jgi:uncharacterized membrane protein
MSLSRIASLVALLHSGAIFGFFYAWVCSTMWGLDAADPRIAIQAMQAMNASVRNPVFAPAFFGTPVVAGLAALLAWRADHRRSAALLAAAAALYIVGAFAPTALVNVPMNLALAATEVPATREAALEIWSAYSSRWQAWNLARTIASGGVLLLVGSASMQLGAGKVRA